MNMDNPAVVWCAGIFSGIMAAAALITIAYAIAYWPW
jgi:hypothetical protein